MYFSMFFSFCKEASWDFVKDYLEFVDNFEERIAALAILTLPIHEHIIRFPLFRPLISFNIFFFFSEYTFWTFVKFILLFDVIINGIIFLIAFLYCSLQIYRNIIVFFLILILYPEALLDSFISSNTFLVSSLELYYTNHIFCE